MMRITTQMVNESARKAGRPINDISLLDYVKQDSSSNNLAGILNNKESALDTVQKKKYMAIEDSAVALEKSADIFSKEKLEEALQNESGNYKDLYEGILKLIENYNSTLQKLKDMPSTFNELYGELLQNALKDQKKVLEEIGITQSKDGTLKLDREKLEKVPLETWEKSVESLLSVGEKIKFISGRISDNAKANVESYSSQYDATGNPYSSINKSKYDFWG